MRWEMVRRLFEEAGDEDGGAGVLPEPAAQPDDKDDIQKLRADLAKQQSNVDQMQRWLLQQTRQAARPIQPVAGAADPKAQINDQFWSDPAGTAAAIAANIQNNTAMQQLQLQAPALISIARNEARNSNPKLFDKYAGEIQAKVATMNLPLQIQPDTWLQALRLTLGEHLEDIQKESSTVPRGGDGPLGVSPKQAAAAPKGHGLSDSELNFASKFGLTPEEYKSGKDMLDSDSQGWENVLTFSSADKRRADAARKSASKAN